MPCYSNEIESDSLKIFVILSATYQQSVLKRYHSDKHFSRFLPTRWRRLHPFNVPLSGTTQVSRYQKGKTNLDFTEARDSEWQWHLLGRMQVCTSLQTDNHAGTPPLSFLQAGCPSCRPTTASKHWRQINWQFSGKSGPKDQVALHYYYTSPSHWCTTHEVSKL